MNMHPGYTLIEVATQRQEEFLREAEHLRKVKLATATSSQRNDGPWVGLKRTAAKLHATSARWLAGTGRVEPPAVSHRRATEA